MGLSIIQLVASLAVILVAAELFTNALEHFGQKMRLSEGVTGSLFAAVGTALPETIVPILAIVSGPSLSSHSEEIGVGTILGAPLMLSTLSIFLMGLAVVRVRGINGVITPEPRGFRRDTGFFLCAFMLSAVTMYIPHHLTGVRACISLSLLLLYGIYVFRTVSASREQVKNGEATEAENSLFLSRAGLPVSMPVILTQIILGVAVLVGGAFWFIDGVEDSSRYFGISALLLSLIIIPIATELPEKINSILWIRRGKDTLALGNITGAMFFQGTMLPAIGILLTPWVPRTEMLTGISVTLTAGFWLWAAARMQRIRIWWLGMNALLYILYLTISLTYQ